MAPLVPLVISPAGSWWWLLIAANATLPGGASPRAAPPGPPAAALPGSQTTRHSPSRRTGSAPSWAHPVPRARSIRAKGSPVMGARPCSQCCFATSMAEWLCDPQDFLSPASFSAPFAFHSPPDSQHPSLCFSAFLLGLSPGLRISLSIPLCAPQLCHASPAVTAVPSSLAGHKMTAVGLWEGKEGMKQSDRRAAARTPGQLLQGALKAGTGTTENVDVCV